MFNNEIYPNLVEKKIINEKMVPTRDQVSDNGYNGFIKAIRRLGENWINLLKDAGFKPNLEYDIIPSYQVPDKIRSFLYDPFGGNPPSTYGLELSGNRKIKVT